MLPTWLSGKEATCQCRRRGFGPWVEKTSLEWEMAPTPVFLPEKFHGQRSPAGYSPWGPKELAMTERLITHKLSRRARASEGEGSPSGQPQWVG